MCLPTMNGTLHPHPQSAVRPPAQPQAGPATLTTAIEYPTNSVVLKGASCSSGLQQVRVDLEPRELAASPVEHRDRGGDGVLALKVNFSLRTDRQQHHKVADSVQRTLRCSHREVMSRNEAPNLVLAAGHLLLRKRERKLVATGRVRHNSHLRQPLLPADIIQLPITQAQDHFRIPSGRRPRILSGRQWRP